MVLFNDPCMVLRYLQVIKIHHLIALVAYIHKAITSFTAVVAQIIIF